MSGSKRINVGLLALALLASLAACATATNNPPPSASYGVMVDMYSGRENPQVELSPRVAEAIYHDLTGRATEFEAAAEPNYPLGFRGFVVTPSGDAQPTLRVTQDTVYSISGAKHEKLADPAGRYYRLILDDVKTRLSQDVLAVLPQPR